MIFSLYKLGNFTLTGCCVDCSLPSLDLCVCRPPSPLVKREWCVCLTCRPSRMWTPVVAHSFQLHISTATWALPLTMMLWLRHHWLICEVHIIVITHETKTRKCPPHRGTLGCLLGCPQECLEWRQSVHLDMVIDDEEDMVTFRISMHYWTPLSKCCVHSVAFHFAL